MGKRVKKILQITQKEYLLDVSKGSVVTTYNKDVAMDISGWNFDQLAYFVSNLRKVGYIKTKILEIPLEEIEGEVVLDGEVDFSKDND